jgi:hypothetical protein
MPTRAEQYRAKSQECANHAERARDPETRRQYELMARQWLDLAEQTDKARGGA